MQRLFDDTAARPHPVRDVRLNSSLASVAIAGVVTGRVRLDNYRADGGRGPVDFSGATRKDQWVPFQLTLLELDVLRRPTLTNPAGRGPDGRPDLDTASISMQGTSMGGLLGANFAALASKLDAVIFHVAGQNFARWFATSSLWEPTPCRTARCRTQLGEMLPAERTRAEDAVLIDMFAQRIDPADAVNTVDFIRHPRAGQTRKPMQMIVGIGDATVPEANSAITARLLDIPLTRPDLAALPGVRRAAEADPDGYELTLHRPFPGGALGRLVSPVLGDGSHYAFGHQSAFRDQQRFLRRFGPVR